MIQYTLALLSLSVFNRVSKIKLHRGFDFYLFFTVFVQKKNPRMLFTKLKK